MAVRVLNVESESVMNRGRLFLVSCFLAAGWPAVAENDTLARNLVATCANCHGTNGHAVKSSGMEALAGAEAVKMLQKLQEFKSGVRPATVMQQIVKGYTDEEIELIVGYLARQKQAGRRSGARMTEDGDD